MAMDEGSRKKVIIGVVALFLAVGYTVYRNLGGDENKGLLAVKVLKCQQCSEITNPSNEELKSMITDRDNAYLEQLAQSDPDMAAQLKPLLTDRANAQSINPNAIAIMPHWGSPRWPFICPNCNEAALYYANECPKCGETFFNYDQEGNYSDKCPKCGYSASEEIRKRSKAKKEAERAKKRKK